MRKIFLVLFTTLFSVSAIAILMKRVYETGLTNGYTRAHKEAQTQIDDLVEMVKTGSVSYRRETPSPNQENSPTTAPVKVQAIPKWNGPELWEAVNRRRIELGVNPLSQKDELCTVASIRLNQLLELGKLDGHEGFSKIPEERADLKWIYDKYNLSEFLVSGAKSPEDAVSLWENTLGHKKLLTGGEYVWGCIYAQNTFAVAIAAY